MAADGRVNESDRNLNCFKCKLGFDDLKSVVECTVCKQFYHGKCENIDLRSVHMKKSTWKCKACPESENKPERSRKRSRVEDIYIDQSTIDTMNATLELLVSKTSELNGKVDLLLAKILKLKEEISKLKGIQPEKSYASVAQSNNKILVINQKGAQKDIKIVKEDLKSKVNPTDIGIGVTMGRSTKKGGLILNCGSEKTITNIQSEIQSKLGDTYSVDRPKMLQHRIKVVGVNEKEYVNDDGEIISKVGVENKLYSRERSKELLYRGRIRVQLKNDDGSLVNPAFPSRDKLMFHLGDMIPKLKTRLHKPSSEQPSQASQGKGKGKGKGRR